MELLFLYVYEFRKIKRQAFSFSSDLQFELEESTTLDGTLRFNISVSENETYVNIFPENILNVTGIIGKNGAGKSTLLDCLKLVCGNLSIITSPLIFIVRNNVNRTLYTCYLGAEENRKQNPKVTVEYSNAVAKKYPVRMCQPYWNDIFGKGTPENLPFSFEDISTCFFTNAFHSHSESFYSGIFNLSTNARLDVFLKQLVKERILDDRKQKKREIEIFPYELNGFHKGELRSMLSFLSYSKSRSTHKIPDLPETLVFNFHFDDYLFLLNDLDSRFKGSSEELQLIHGIAFEQIQNSDNHIEAFQKLLLLCTYYYILKWNFVERDSLRHNINSYMEDTIKYPHHLFDNLKNVINSVKTKSPDKQHQILMNMLEKSAASQLSGLTVRKPWDPNNVTRFDFEINSSLWPVLSQIHDITDIENLSFIDYGWGGGLSTGQEAFIAHFARLHDVKKKVGDKPIWLLIDEGDLHFHPEMQKEYFSQLLTFVHFLFHRNKVQIILSTHSPFIVSDLPKQNLIFLKTDPNGNCKVDNENLKHETFGANIHDLFKDSLFLSGGLMGDFAKSKIDEVINWCTDDNSRSKVDYYKGLVDIIGEPIVKMKLSEMIAKKMGEDQELARLQEQEIYIRRRIEELKSKNDKDQK